MSTHDQYSLDETPPPGAGALTPRQRWWLTLAGGMLGAIVGPSGFLLQMRLSAWQSTGRDLVQFPGSPARWAERIGEIGNAGAVQLFIVGAFVVTMALMPRLIQWIEARVDRSSRSYYASAAGGGIALGIVATVLVAWMLMVAAVVAGLASGTPEADASMAVLSVLGTLFVFGPIVGIVTPFFFVLPIVGIGVVFGLGLGVVIRRLTRPRKSLAAQPAQSAAR